MNLLDETVEFLKKHKLGLDDVNWIGSKNGKTLIPKNKWGEILDVNYLNQHGHEGVCYDLVIVGRDWWLSRGSCGDRGSFWIYNIQPLVMEYVVPGDRAMGHRFYGKHSVNNVIGLKTRSIRSHENGVPYEEVPASYYDDKEEWL